MIFTQHASKGHAYRTKIKELLSDVMKLKRTEKSAVLGSLRELRTRIALRLFKLGSALFKKKKKEFASVTAQVATLGGPSRKGQQIPN